MSGSWPPVLNLEALAPGRYRAPHPHADADAEGRDVVFAGQILAQAIVAAEDVVQGGKETLSLHAVFSRVGRFRLPLELAVESTHDGSSFASLTVTALQDARPIARVLLLLSAAEPDLVRHGPPMPEVPEPEALAPGAVLAFPGLDTRPVPGERRSARGSPEACCWLRLPAGGSPATRRAIVAWSQPGAPIGLALEPHPGVALSDAYRSLSTGVVAHTAHFHEPLAGEDWLLVVNEADYAGRGRIFGTGRVFARNGRLVASFAQDGMVRAAQGPRPTL